MLGLHLPKPARPDDEGARHVATGNTARPGPGALPSAQFRRQLPRRLARGASRLPAFRAPEAGQLLSGRTGYLTGVCT
jgi:hypothetical protein